jgi:hypothetical protein
MLAYIHYFSDPGEDSLHTTSWPRSSDCSMEMDIEAGWHEGAVHYFSPSG